MQKLEFLGPIASDLHSRHLVQALPCGLATSSPHGRLTKDSFSPFSPTVLSLVTAKGRL